VLTRDERLTPTEARAVVADLLRSALGTTTTRRAPTE
jgi:hypothetical protein